VNDWSADGGGWSGDGGAWSVGAPSGEADDSGEAGFSNPVFSGTLRVNRGDLRIVPRGGGSIEVPGVPGTADVAAFSRSIKSMLWMLCGSV